MKIIFLFLSFWVLNVENIQAEEPVNAEKGIPTKIEQDVERYQKECSQQAYPGDYRDHIYALADDSLKHANQKYHQCIKKIIIDKISSFASNEESVKMIQSLNELQTGILNFYGILYNMRNDGIVGRQKNDAALGYYYDIILEDIIQYEQNLQYY